MKKLILLLVITLLYTIVYSQNVGIGTTIPDSTLTINGSIHLIGNALLEGNLKLPNGAGTGKVLQSDSIGNAIWGNLSYAPASNLPSAQICGQYWTSINLDVSTYRNGDPIPQVNDATAWFGLSTGAWCWYNNDSAANHATFGKLYNWYAVNDPRGLAPIGWHIPSDNEWNKIINCLGGETIAGGRMKFPGSNLWSQPTILGSNNASTNISGFSAVESHARGDFGTWWGGSSYGANWWSSSEVDPAKASYYNMVYYNFGVSKLSGRKYYGFSVRCVRD